ncbi:MAG: hypothetical protein Q9167_007086, partial [Letrouitia subvulpina]
MTATRPSTTTTKPARNRISASLSWSLDFTSVVVAALKASHHIFFSQPAGPSFRGWKARSFLEDRRAPAPLLYLNPSSSAQKEHKIQRSDSAHRGMYDSLPLFGFVKLEAKKKGLHLLETSLHVSSIANASPSATASPDFSKELYVHALVHLLYALPRDLTAAQTHALASALPPRLWSHATAGAAEEQQPYLEEEREVEQQQQPQPQTSLLRRVLASCVLFLFLLARFLLPCARDVAVAACAYDREHGISERALRHGAGVGRRCWE